MAKPRVFLSSTYYDLKSLRGELERFIRDKGYDPVLNERGNVTYSKETSPEISCYREIETCDILVSVIGGRFGSSAHDGSGSISQLELKTALDQYKQVYIFVERDVLSEYRTYLKNKDAVIEWAAVNDIKIYHFLDDIHNLPNNNAIMSFETGHEIITLLREQWAGLFQRMLQGQASTGTLETAQELRQGLETVRQVVQLLKSGDEKPDKSDKTINGILMPDHPAFSRVKRLLKVPYRVYFTTLSEFNAWITVRNYREVDKSVWDSPNEIEWVYTKDDANYDMLKISASMFDATGKFQPDVVEWSDNLIRKEIRPKPSDSSDDVDTV